MFFEHQFESCLPWHLVVPVGPEVPGVQSHPKIKDLKLVLVIMGHKQHYRILLTNGPVAPVWPTGPRGPVGP